MSSLNRRQLMARLAALGLAAPAAGAFTALTRPSTAFAQAKQGGTLTYGFWQPISNLDPQVGGLQVESMINQNTMDPLIWMKPGDPKYYPGLATSWEASPDSKTYTIKLRTDVKFHDGTPLNADAVKFMFDRIANPNTKPGAAARALGPYESSEVIDDATVKVNFKAANGAFLNNLTTVWLAPQSPAMVKQYGPDYQDHLAGTGPYMLKEYAHNDHVTLVRNPDYNWAPPIFKHTGPGILDSIVFRLLPEDATRVAALKSGDIDIMDRVPPRDLADFGSNGDFKTFSGPTGGIPWIFQLNTKKAPTDDPAVRQAMMKTFDQAAVVDLLFKGTLEPAYSMVEPTMVGFSEETKKLISHDPDGAKKLLDDAGWKPGSGGIREKDGQLCKVSLMIVSNFGMDDMSIALQGQMQDVGIQVDIHSAEAAAAFASLAANEHNAGWAFFFGVDPSLGLNAFFGSSAIGQSNYSNYSNPQVDQWLADGIATSDTAKRAEIYNNVVTQLITDVAALPAFNKRQVLAAKKSVDLESVMLNTEGYPNLYDVGFLS
jgi:peptide/nickel transport system substrate-binding protein